MIEHDAFRGAGAAAGEDDRGQSIHRSLLGSSGHLRLAASAPSISASTPTTTHRLACRSDRPDGETPQPL